MTKCVLRLCSVASQLKSKHLCNMKANSQNFSMIIFILCLVKLILSCFIMAYGVILVAFLKLHLFVFVDIQFLAFAIWIPILGFLTLLNSLWSISSVLRQSWVCLYLNLVCQIFLALLQIGALILAMRLKYFAESGAIERTDLMPYLNQYGSNSFIENFVDQIQVSHINLEFQSQAFWKFNDFRSILCVVVAMEP